MANVKRFKDWATDPRQTSKWKRFRRLVRSTYPRCEVQGCDQLSEEVHHIIPVTHGMLGRAKAFEWSNVRAVCRACHPAADAERVSWKPRPPRAAEDGGPSPDPPHTPHSMP